MYRESRRSYRPFTLGSVQDTHNMQYTYYMIALRAESGIAPDSTPILKRYSSGASHLHDMALSVPESQKSCKYHMCMQAKARFVFCQVTLTSFSSQTADKRTKAHSKGVNLP